MRALMMSIQSTDSHFWDCPSGANFCEPTMPGTAERRFIGDCMSMTVASWDRVCPITVESSAMVQGYVAYSQGTNTCGFYLNTSSTLKGNATLNPARSDWPPSVAQPSCNPHTVPCSVAPPGSVQVTFGLSGGDYCTYRSCP
jgi:hypothetical protein